MLEALACGAPVIVTSAPDNLARFLVKRSPRGTVCEPTAAGLAGAIGGVLDRLWTPAPSELEWLGEYDWNAICSRVAQVLA